MKRPKKERFAAHSAGHVLTPGYYCGDGFEYPGRRSGRKSNEQCVVLVKTWQWKNIVFCGFVWLKKPKIHCVHTCGGLTENDLAHIADGRRTPAYFSKKLALWYRHCIHLWLLCIVLCTFLVIRLYSCFVSVYCIKSPCGHFGSLCFVFLCTDLLTVPSCTAE